MKKYVAIAGLLMTTCATITTTHLFTSYQDWDANKDGAIQRAEFIDGYSGSNYFSKWNNGSTSTRSISYDDFLNDAFTFLDTDKNAKLDKSEFDSQIDKYYFGIQSNSFGQWDKNSNGAIDKTEFIQRAKNDNLAPLWDVDSNKSISEYEMASGMFDLCNTNKDLKVDQQEFDVWRAKRNADVSNTQALHQ